LNSISIAILLAMVLDGAKIVYCLEIRKYITFVEMNNFIK
jgi:hypothetical protein